MIYANEKYLTYQGDEAHALKLVQSIREAYGSSDLPKMLNDFIFNIEVALQNAGILNEWFEQAQDCQHEGEYSWWEYDAQGIPLCRVCDKCIGQQLSRYRPEILTGYTQADVDEPIEEE